MQGAALAVGALITGASGAGAVQVAELEPAVLAGQSDLTAAEGGNPALLPLSLTVRPQGTVTLRLAGDAECRVTPEVLEFSPANWANPQTVSVIAIPDEAPEGPHSCQPTAQVDTADSAYQSAPAVLPRVAIRDDLVDRIAERLRAVLHKDFATTLRGHQSAFEGMLTSAVARLKRGQYGLRCGHSQAFDVKGHAEVKETSAGVRGAFGDEIYYCLGAERRIGTGRFSLSHSDMLGRQSLLTYTRQTEKQDARHLKGFFLGGYGSETAVAKLATGTISGVGASAGLYGVDRLRKVLMVSYYAALVAGRHSFDLGFDQTGGEIDARGHYDYGAGFGALALTGQRAAGPVVLHPKAGLYAAYGQAPKVDVTGRRSGLTSTGTVDIPEYRGMRSALEMGVEYERPAATQLDWQTTYWMAPSLYCQSDVVQGDLDCGSGLKLDLNLYGKADHTVWGLSIEAEADRKRRQRAMTLSRTLLLGAGTGQAVTSFGLDDRSKPKYGYELSLDF
ncbi:hypothetical protein [Donghicola mangrovi]|uniref:Autotransporter domain-containing protein n=1 Tax=Donghicola mangrovi TaxID=2729614 RepID=A0A850PY39_9RHOB|nr:hypothetical protein [Donghicola mangrovi]NVO21746.1 hypothetical protein [Donghicola mangrovi]